MNIFINNRLNLKVNLKENMETITLPSRYWGNYRTIKDLLVLERLSVEHFLIGEVFEEEDDHFLLGATHIITPDWVFRQQYDQSYPLGYRKRNLSNDDPLFPVLEYEYAESHHQLIVPPSPQECAQDFTIHSDFLPYIREHLENTWNLGIGTITIHNHPAITYSSLDRESQESLQVLYDLSDKSTDFWSFVRDYLRTRQRTPSETDLAITRQFSNKGIGLIALGRTKLILPEMVNPDPQDYIGFKVLDHGYEPVQVQLPPPPPTPPPFPHLYWVHRNVSNKS